jgi:hypothetical protein
MDKKFAQNVGIDPATPNDCTWSDNAGLFVTK